MSLLIPCNQVHQATVFSQTWQVKYTFAKLANIVPEKLTLCPFVGNLPACANFLQNLWCAEGQGGPGEKEKGEFHQIT